jgi:nucleoside-triphosphatase THEP1
MELFSAAFCQAIADALDSDCTVLGTIVKRSKPFSDQVKARPDVTLIEVHAGNRDDLVDDLVMRLQELNRFDPD